MREPLLEFHHVSFTPGDQAVLHDISLTIHEQEIVGLVFQQGLGKTSLLRIGAGLIEPSAGEVVFRGQRVRSLRATDAPFGFVFHDGGLLENLTIFDNVALPVRYHTRHDEAFIAARVGEVLRAVGMEEHAERFPWELTRDRQRLASLARALVRDPDLVFVDDFFRGADAGAFQQLEDAVRAARDERRTAFALVLEAFSGDFGVVDRLCLIDHGSVLEMERPG